MWDLPGPGFEPMYPALAGRFLTTVPRGKPQAAAFWWCQLSLTFLPLSLENPTACRHCSWVYEFLFFLSQKVLSPFIFCSSSSNTLLLFRLLPYFHLNCSPLASLLYPIGHASGKCFWGPSWFPSSVSKASSVLWKEEHRWIDRLVWSDRLAPLAQ